MAAPDQGFVMRIKGIVRPVFALFAAVFVVLVAKDMASRFSGLTVEIRWGWVAASLLPALIAVLFQYRAWWELVSLCAGHKMPRALSLRVYVDGQMARYTPGKVGLPAVRVAGARLLGVTPQIMLSTLFAEILAWSACGTILGGLLIYTSAGKEDSLQLANRFLGWLGLASTAGLLLLMAVPVRVWPSKVVALLGFENGGTLMPLRVPAFQFMHFGASASCGFLLVLSLGGTAVQGVYLGAVLCVAIVAGFLALLAPAGVGVREAMIALFAEPMLGTNQAVALGLLARAVSLSAELLLFALMRWLTRGARPVQVGPESAPECVEP